jgi:cytoskeletal protein RodZ
MKTLNKNIPNIPNLLNISFLSFNKSQDNQEHTELDKAKKLAELGAILRNVREKNNISLERVAIFTMIRSNLLDAIESGDIEQLPEPVYAQGLIKRYAEVLGVDVTPYSDLFTTELTKTETLKSVMPNWWMSKIRPFHLYLFYIIVIVAAVNVLSVMISREDKKETAQITTPQSLQPLSLSPSPITKQPVTKPLATPLAKTPATATNHKVVAQVPQTTVTPPTKVTPSPSPSSTPNNKSEIDKNPPTKSSEKQGISVTVTVKKNSWAQIEIDGKVEFEGELTEGTKHSWEAKEKLVFITGNAGGVLVGVNNAEAKPLGEIGSVKEITLTPANPHFN